MVLQDAAQETGFNPEIGRHQAGDARRPLRPGVALCPRQREHLADHAFVAADRFTIADITLYITCGFCRVMKWAPHKELPNLGRWHAEMTARGFAG